MADYNLIKDLSIISLGLTGISGVWAYYFHRKSKIYAELVESALEENQKPQTSLTTILLRQSMKLAHLIEGTLD